MQETCRQWDHTTWRLAESVVVVQGVGPYLQDVLPHTTIYPVLPASFRERLAQEHLMKPSVITISKQKDEGRAGQLRPRD